MANKFNKDYYQRFYLDPVTRAMSPTEAKNLAHFIAAYARHIELPVKTILDIGCGTGQILTMLQQQFPTAKITGVEFSDYLCKSMGWQQGSVVEYKSKQPFDLVVCSDVLPYLKKKMCKTAIANLTKLTGGALYLGILTEEDMEICDRDRTDLDQYIRPVSWYRKQLDPHFTNIGGGLFVKKDLNLALWQLDILK